MSYHIICVFCVFACRSPEGDTNITPPRQSSAGDGGGELEAADSAPAAIHRWPLRPGVHVHVNGVRNLATNPTSTPTSSTSSTTNFIRASAQYSAMPTGTVGSRKRTVQRREQQAKATATVYPAAANINNNSIGPGGNLANWIHGVWLEEKSRHKNWSSRSRAACLFSFALSLPVL